MVQKYFEHRSDGYWYGPPMYPSSTDEEDYTVDISGEVPSTDSISAVSWTVTGASADLGRSGFTQFQATVWLTNALVSPVLVVARITTNAGRVITRQFRVELLTDTA